MARRRKSLDQIIGAPVEGDVDLLTPSRFKEGAGELMSWAKTLQIIVEQIPARTSLRQAYAFALIAEANALGKSG